LVQEDRSRPIDQTTDLVTEAGMLTCTSSEAVELAVALAWAVESQLAGG
jgi:hypothetical protein